MWKPQPDEPLPDGWQRTDTARDFAGVIRRYWWTPIAVILVAAFVYGVAETGGDEPANPATVDGN